MRALHVVGSTVLVGAVISLLPVEGPAEVHLEFEGPRIEQGTLEAGETFESLLLRLGMEAGARREITEGMRSVVAMRRLRPGLTASVLKGPGGDLRQVLLMPDADRIIIASRESGSWSVRQDSVQVYPDTLAFVGVIHGSMYQSLVQSPRLADYPLVDRQIIVDLLAEGVFAWTIDFSREIQEGDRFAIAATRMARPDGSGRDYRIEAARVEVGGRAREAYRYAGSPQVAGYYDSEGKSLRGAFLRAPLEFRRISSVFSSSRVHPVTGRRKAHRGVDYAASRGTPVRATGSGVIQRAGNAGTFGILVEIRHPRHGITTRYAHLNGVAKGIRAGTSVRQGQIIGYVGSTGLSTGPHLHYEMMRGGAQVNPLASTNRRDADLSAGDRARHVSGLTHWRETMDSLWLQAATGVQHKAQ